MAYKENSSELEVARRARDFARVRSPERIGNPNLTKFGGEKGLVSPTPQARRKSAVALKKEYGNGREKSVRQIEREVVGDSNVLKGKVKAMQAARGNVGQKKQALKLEPTLTVPVARNLRATNKDGATSFHFKYEAIAKTKQEKVSASGTKTRKNAGRDHAKYLERQSAVAQSGKLAHEAGSPVDGDGIADALGRAATGGRYIEREEALAYQENGVPVIFSNISQDAEKRQKFWETVEERETEPNPDHLKIVTGQDPEFWEAVGSDPRCPKQLALAIEEADPALPYRVRTDDNEPVREILADHGWSPPSARKPNETSSEKAERKRLDQQNSKGAHCEDGRGGRIQNRIVGELPNEISHDQRINILRRFAAEFEEKKLPYVAVMHAPDQANNKTNWHFHLAYYARPCSHFTGKVDDYVNDLKPFANEHDEARHKAKVEAFKTTQFQKYKGQWDFAVPMVRVLKDRRTVVMYPFAQVKDRDCTAPGYPLELRKLLAEITNDELQIAGASRRVDPRRFSEMGIDKEAEEHLGSRSAQMECLGIATPRGVENEHRQWQYTLDVIEQKLKANERNTFNEERRYRQALESRELSPADHSEVGKMITNWSQTQSQANELTAIAAELKQHLERAQSRALKVEETCKRHLVAIEDGKANKRQSDNKANYEARLIEATDHLKGLTVILASEISQEKRTREEAARLSEEASKMRKEVDDRLKEEMAALIAGLAIMNNQDKKTPLAEDDKAPTAANDDTKAEAKPVLAIDMALSVWSNGGNGVAPSGPANGGARSSLGSPSPAAAPSMPHRLAGVSPAENMAKPASRTEVMRKIDDLADATTPIIHETKDGREFYRLGELDMKIWGLVERDLRPVPVQTRLRGIHQKQEGDIKRLVGFIRHSPGRTEAGPLTLYSNNQPVVGLAGNAPADLRALSDQYAQHPIAQERMSVAFRRAKAELIKGMAAVSRPASLTHEQRKTELKPELQKDAEPKAEWRHSELSAPDAMRAGTAPEVSIDVTKPLGNRSESPGHQQARSDEKEKPAAPEPQAETPERGERVSERRSEQQTVAQKPGPTASGTETGREPSLSAEERSELLGPRTFGMEGGSKPAPIQATNEETVQAAGRPLKLSRGAHPKIDAWIDALDSRDLAARQIAALALRNDREALKIGLQALDAKTQVRIRLDWEALEAKLQTQKCKVDQMEELQRSPR